MNTGEIKKEDLLEYFQINISIIGTKGASKEDGDYEYDILTKEELLERLEEIIPEDDFGYSILSVVDEKEKGL